MPRAVRYDSYGPLAQIYIAEVDQPEPAAGEVVVEVVAAGINPGEVPVREGLFHAVWPATFPSGQGSDFAGRVVSVGADAHGVSVDDEVIGFTNQRSAQADYVRVPTEQLTAKPPQVSWEQAGGLFVVGTTAYAAVRAVGPRPAEVVAVSAAAGGVGSLAVQLAKRTGARVLGIAGQHNHAWLRKHGVEPIGYGDGLADRLRAAAPQGLDALIDTWGEGYVALAIELGIPADRINTVADFAAAATYGAKTEGSMSADNAGVLGELAGLVATGELTLEIARSYPLEQVREAYRELGNRHTRGKIVLRLR